MAGESTNPPPASGGAKYALVGVGLIAGAVALWLGMRGCEEPKEPTTQVDAGAPVRNTSLADENLVIPDPEPDAGPTPDAGPVKRRIVYRYVQGDWECAGDIPRAEIQAVIRENQPQVRSCYERRLKVNNTLAGNVMVSMRIGSNGEVTAVRVGGSLGDNEVLSCIRSLADDWRFPAPSAGNCAVVQAPFSLTPRNP